MSRSDIEILQDNLYLTKACHLIDSSKTEILLATYKLQISAKPGRRRFMKIISALANSIRRGVKVKILIHYRPSLKGVPSSNIVAMKLLKGKGAEIRYLPEKRIVHAKILIFDAIQMITGSHNLSISSLLSNVELSLLVNDSLVVIQVRKYFLDIWNEAKPFE